MTDCDHIKVKWCEPVFSLQCHFKYVFSWIGSCSYVNQLILTMQYDIPIRRMGVQRRNTGEAQHKCKKSWKVFDIISHGAVLWLWNVFQFGIPKSLSYFYLPLFLQPCCVTLYCSWCIRLKTWKMCFVWSNSKIMYNHHKASTTDANL